MQKSYSRLLLLSFAILFFVSGAQAVTFTDDFSTYDDLNFYRVIDYTDSAGVTLATDANTVSSIGIMKDGNSSFTVHVDVNSNVANTAQAVHVGIPKVSISDWNSTGRLYFHWITDSNAFISRVDIRIGGGTGQYWEYRNTGPWGGQFFLGDNIIGYDLNNAQIRSGSPSMDDINFFQVIVVYSASQVDFNFTVNKIWVEKPGIEGLNGGLANNWVVLNAGSAAFPKPDGWALPFEYALEGPGMAVMDNNIPSLANHGRVFVPAFDAVDTSTQDFNWTVDLNMIPSEYGARFIFDWTGGNDFTSVLVAKGVDAAHKNIGVEKWVAGVLTQTYTSIPMAWNEYRTLSFRVTGNDVNVYLDTNNVHNATLSGRVDGRVGIESFRGRIHVKNLTIVSSDFAASAEPDTSTIDFDYTKFFDAYDSVTSAVSLLVILIILMGVGYYFYANYYTGSNQLASSPFDSNSMLDNIVALVAILFVILLVVLVSARAISFA